MEAILLALSVLVLIFAGIRILAWFWRLGKKTHDSQYKRQFIHEHRLQEEALREYKKGR